MCRLLCLGLIWLGLGILVADAQELRSQARRPDLVVFLTDDLSQLDASPYGSHNVPTPHMQRLAEAGMTFWRSQLRIGNVLVLGKILEVGNPF